VTARPGYDPDAAEENSQRKAGPIASYAYRLGISWEDLGTLPYSDKEHRKAPTLRRFAAAAFTAAGVAENVPHSRTSDTWHHVREALAELEDREAYGYDPPPRDLLDQHSDWIRPALTVVPDPPSDPVGKQEPTQVSAPPRPPRPRPTDLVPYDVPPALVTSGDRPGRRPAAADLPRGWADLAALGPLDPPRPCRWCGGDGVVGTLNGWRCPDHPPRQGDPRGDWGWALDWTPTPETTCLASACYCGRCPHYDPAGPPMKSGARAGVGAAETALRGD
jgi:hypothetical protein